MQPADVSSVLLMAAACKIKRKAFFFFISVPLCYLIAKAVASPPLWINFLVADYNYKYFFFGCRHLFSYDIKKST